MYILSLSLAHPACKTLLLSCRIILQYRIITLTKNTWNSIRARTRRCLYCLNFSPFPYKCETFMRSSLLFDAMNSSFIINRPQSYPRLASKSRSVPLLTDIMYTYENLSSMVPIVISAFLSKNDREKLEKTLQIRTSATNKRERKKYIYICYVFMWMSHVNIFLYVYMYVCVYIWVCVCVCMYISMCVCQYENQSRYSTNKFLTCREFGKFRDPIF